MHNIHTQTLYKIKAPYHLVQIKNVHLQTSSLLHFIRTVIMKLQKASQNKKVIIMNRMPFLQLRTFLQCIIFINKFSYIYSSKFGVWNSKLNKIKVTHCCEMGNYNWTEFQRILRKLEFSLSKSDTQTTEFNNAGK